MSQVCERDVGHFGNKLFRDLFNNPSTLWVRFLAVMYHLTEAGILTRQQEVIAGLHVGNRSFFKINQGLDSDNKQSRNTVSYSSFLCGTKYLLSKARKCYSAQGIEKY